MTEVINKKILYVDMDGVVADFNGAMELLSPGVLELPDGLRETTIDDICTGTPGVFRMLEPIPGARSAVKLLAREYDLYFLSTPMYIVPDSYRDKRLWLEQHFGDLAKKRLILSHNKHLNIGDYLIDDRPHNGADRFRGELIKFGSSDFPSWFEVLEYLL